MSLFPQWNAPCGDRTRDLGVTVRQAYLFDISTTLYQLS
jgi:hypothetical protein